ncbi:hypothetical protein L3X38_037724 [Prunus dulcis]|uniref:Uncharacterized protein n=1 Tax=Prunus dulcis TaxID=3755 RepID=A0AAD4V5T4_PRUDU|nr:hypothetical protein L3X38_037724 [Prunus dulcis]
MSKNFDFNKTEFKGNNMKKESYEGSSLGSARSGSAAELSQLLAGGRKTENWNEPSNWGTNSQPARTVDNLKTRTSVISPTRADYPIKGLQQHPVKDAPGSDNSKYLKYPYASSKSGEDHFLQLRGGPIRAATSRNFSLKFGPNPRFSNRFFYTQNRSKPTQPAARTRKMEEKPYLNHRVWTAEAAARRRASSGSNQSSSRPEFVVSDGENGQVLVGATRRVDRDRSRVLPWPELREPRRERADVGERETKERECRAKREKAEVKI